MKVSRRSFLAGGVAAAAAAWTAPGAEGSAEARPNVLWITCEDTSADIGCFGDAYARTPNLDALAAAGVRYTRAFAAAPVCSPVRSGLITGMYATSLGTQRLRSDFPVPAEIRPFTAALRAAGYHCTNNRKTDYNLADAAQFTRAAWDECSGKAHWRSRRPGQPFFAVFNIETTHQSRASVWKDAEFERQVGSRLAPGERSDPAKAPLPPYYPDVPSARRMMARYYDCIRVMDGEVGELLRQLREDGLEEDTIVFFYPDQGRGLPRGKRVLHDTGLRIPLILRFPARFRKFAPAPAGGACDRLVSTVDFGPTVLSLAGLPVPGPMEGRPFLGAGATAAREVVFGARDRVDEAFDVSRSVRDGRFLYLRNYMPHLSWMQPEGYSDQSDFRRELRKMAAEGRLNADQLTYAAPRRALEELYDTDADPHQIRNLAGVSEHRKTLEQMRARLREWMLASRDAGFLTEPQWRERIAAGGTPREKARDDKVYPLARLLEAADAVGRPGAVARQQEWLCDANDGVRYWAAVGLNAAGKAAEPARAALTKALADPCGVVRIESAMALANLGETAPALAVLERELEGADAMTSVHAARALELLGDAAKPVFPAMRRKLEEARKTKADGGLYLRFCLNEALGTREDVP